MRHVTIFVHDASLAWPIATSCRTVTTRFVHSVRVKRPVGQASSPLLTYQINPSEISERGDLSHVILMLDNLTSHCLLPERHVRSLEQEASYS
ncbi:hypothetical protein Bxe_B2973 [Paraburkholderia xenovorans LB400]|uniref:Uncharacterized protein n=1 Tax=Paraburkholderia xenovorans (strain LB400) TaxID=266265 RepID=Q13SB7_PARXL|nr:hypothetical protein Bxe_B2973 [Paraburkholderia xenovorans LB400]